MKIILRFNRLIIKKNIKSFFLLKIILFLDGNIVRSEANCLIEKVANRFVAWAQPRRKVRTPQSSITGNTRRPGLAGKGPVQQKASTVWL